MTDFKVGDKAEIRTGIEAPWEGAAVTVTETNRRATGGSFDVRVERADGQTALFDYRELKLVQPKHKFKVGDTVTFCMAGFDGWQGGEGIVRSLPTYARQYYKVEIVTPPPTNNAQRPGNRVDLLEEWLAVPAAPKLKFKVGAIVKSIGFQYASLKNTTLIVDHLTGDPMYPYAVRALGEDYEKGHNFRENELELDDTGLAEWEIELLDSSRPSLKIKALADYAVADVKATQAIFESAVKKEAVKHPAHYGGGDNPYEAIKVIEAWGLGFNLGNAAKYLARAGKKGNKVEDLKKLIQYVQFEIAKEEAK